MKQNNGCDIEKNVFHFHLGNLAVFLTIRAEKEKIAYYCLD